MEKTALTAKPLALFSLPLKGRQLIEASAGTGKTFSITHIYLRLLLQLGEHCFDRPLSVREILVVTFTNAAKEELRNRIRRTLSDAIALFEAFLPEASTPNATLEESQHALMPFIEHAKQQHRDFNAIIEQLIYAEQSMDEAAIYTLDGFSLKIAKRFALLIQYNEELTLIEHQNELLLSVIKAFWRTYFYPLQDPFLVSIIQEELKSPETLLKIIQPLLNAPLPRDLNAESLAISELLQNYLAKWQQFETQLKKVITAIKQHWQSATFSILDKITAYQIRKNSCKESDLLIVEQWIDSEEMALPKEIERFFASYLIEKQNKNGQFDADFAFFEQLEQLAQKAPKAPSFIETLLPAMALDIQTRLEAQKAQLEAFEHGDPLKSLIRSLDNPNIKAPLIQALQQAYPVALIDEFQDTDLNQYAFFDAIYQDKAQCGLILIGDPKQAIYGFRGGDIFTYIKAKQEADAIYSIRCNWRSSGDLVSAVNRLFSIENAFQYEEIPFEKVEFAPQNAKKQFLIAGKPCQALELHCVPSQEIAHYCAQKIADWLLNAALVNGDQPQKVRANDIVVLVRNRSEAQLIQTALRRHHIPSLYVSDQDSLFSAIETQWLLFLFEAILNRTQIKKIMLACATPLFGFNMAQLQQMNESGEVDAIVRDFEQLETLYHQKGVFVMLRTLLTQNQTTNRLLNLPQGDRHLTNLLHLSELLQEAAQTHGSLHALLEWLKHQMAQNKAQKVIQRLENTQNVIRIYSIHKSKGLEFNVVCLPFLSALNSKSKSTSFIYHDEKHALQLGFAGDEAQQKAKQKEEEAELLRLAYVALTRAVYHCLLTFSDFNAKGKEKKMPLMAPLLNRETPIEGVISEPETIVKIQEKQATSNLSAADFTRALTQKWRISSYSGLLREDHSQPDVLDLAPAADELDLPQTASDDLKAPSERVTLWNFPKGAHVGTILHQLLEQIDFQQPLTEQKINKALLALKMPENPLIRTQLTQFYQELIETPLDETGLRLSQISKQRSLSELTFLFAVKGDLDAKKLDQLMKKHDPLSQKAPCLTFKTLTGLLTGTIDFIFEFENRFYIVDYKSNFLGETQADYQQNALEAAMIAHRYDLQYQLYTLALHRYLRSRLPNYDYERHFGGVFYLFLRGMNGKSSRGVYAQRPKLALIEQLDQMMQSPQNKK